MTRATVSHVSITRRIFLQPAVSVPESNWPTLNISYSPSRQPPPFPRSLVQPSLPVCRAVLCSTRSSALSAGDRLFGIYPLLLLCLSLHLQPFIAVKSSLSSPLSLFSPPLTLQLNSFRHPPAGPSRHLCS